MFLKRFSLFCMAIYLLSGTLTFAAEDKSTMVSVNRLLSKLVSVQKTQDEMHELQPKDLPHVGYWIFSGLVKNENQEFIGYFFKVKRENAKFHVQAALIDDKSGQIVLSYDHYETLEEPDSHKWKIGNAFLRFNPINESWIFGVKMPDKTGFNFRVDLLTQPVNKRETQNLADGMETFIHETGQLDGMLQIKEQKSEQFVTASRTWFAKTWLYPKNPDRKYRPVFNTALCRFNNGAGFYSGDFREAEKRESSFGAFRDEEGKPVRMSQFMQIDSDNNQLWKIHLAEPKLTFELPNRLSEIDMEKGMAAGFFENQSRGFCFFSELRFPLARDVLG